MSITHLRQSFFARLAWPCLLGAALVCGTGSVWAADPAPSVAPPAPVAHFKGVSCTQQRPDWNAACVAGDLHIDIYLDGCSTDGFYGKVESSDGKPIELRDALPAGQGQVVAKLSNDQFVCVSANARTASATEAQWYYVTAIPVGSLKACKGNANCAPGDLPITWVQTKPTATCHPGPDGKYTGGCAAGWVKAEQFDEYSMGL